MGEWRTAVVIYVYFACSLMPFPWMRVPSEIPPAANDAAIPKRYVRYIIKLQSSHRSWVSWCESENFSPLVFGVCSSSPRVFPFEKGQSFFLSRYCYARPSLVALVIASVCFSWPQISSFFTHSSSLSMKISHRSIFFAGLDKTFSSLSTATTSVAWHFYVCKYRRDGGKEEKNFAVALWLSRKSTHNTLTRIFRHSNFL